MAVNERAIEKRAREFARQDGFVWELTYKPKPNLPQRPASEEQRRAYLERARTELWQKTGNA